MPWWNSSHTVPRIDIGDRYQMLNPRFRGEILDYESCVDAAEAQVHQVSDKVVFPGVMAAWDNTPRRRDLATIFANASPQAYGRWLTAACRRALAAPAADHRLVFINAWNEWAEGSYLEQHRRHAASVVGANRLDQHRAEITAMYAVLGPDLATAPGLARRQRDYLASLRRQ